MKNFQDLPMKHNHGGDGIDVFSRNDLLFKINIEISLSFLFRSRQWGVVEQYRLGRIMWRRFADYNQMSGVMRTTFDRYTRQNTEMMSRERRIIREDP